MQLGSNSVMLDELLEVAEFGVPSAQLTLFLLYANGWLIEADTRKFAEHLTKFRRSDDPVIQYFVSSYLVSCATQQEEFMAAFELCQRSADQGFPPAQHMLAGCYQFGRGVDRDPTKAFEWDLLAAQQGFIPAQLTIASMFGEGLGTAKDPRQSFHWYLEAAKRGSAEGAHCVATMYEIGDGAMLDEKLALHWYLEAAERGSWIAHGSLAGIYRLGRLGQTKDPVLSEQHEQSAERLKATLRNKARH